MTVARWPNTDWANIAKVVESGPAEWRSYASTSKPVFEYTGGMKLRSEPVVVRIGDGVIEYQAADQIAKILAVRDSAQKAADRLYKNAKSQQLTSSEVTSINHKLDAAYKAQTSLRSNVVDPSGKSVGTFLDEA